MKRIGLVPIVVTVLVAGRATAQPKPGDVFREYRYVHDTIIEADPDNTTQKNPKFIKRQAISGRERNMDIWDLEDAVRAEIALELFGGHAGTTGHKVRVNAGPWRDIPQLAGTPSEPACYLRTQMGSAIVPVAIKDLKQGRNVFQFRSGGQICHSINWGIFKVYAFTVRVYYDPAAKPRPQGRVIAPARFGDNPVLTAEVQATLPHADKTEFTGASVVRVDYVGLYQDFNWEGDGVFRQWHHQLEQGELKRHIGTATSAPWKVTWDNRWVPDQDQPVQISARITDTHGIVTMTPAVTVTMERKGRSVRMYAASDVPEKFGVRVGEERKTCKIEVADDPRKARSARLMLTTWAGSHGEALGLNDQKIVDHVGAADYYSFDAVEFNPRLVRKGTNTFFISSRTEEHHAEVHWPGPVLLLEYGRAPAAPPPKLSSAH